MSYNPTVRRYAKDLGVAVPNPRESKCERPNLNTTIAPYLPLGMEQERFDEYQVVQIGKVMALDSLGFLTLAGLRIQLRLLGAAIVAADVANTTLDASAVANLTRYRQVDVDKGVKNSRGQTVKLGEPVVFSMVKISDVFLPQYNIAVAGSSTAVVIPNAVVVTYSVDVGNHIGFQTAPAYRTASDVLSRSASEFRSAATGTDARRPLDSTDDREENWSLGLQHFTVLVAEESFKYPVVATRAPILFDGMAVAIGASLAAFELGGLVTYNFDSDIVPANAANIAWALTPVVTSGDDAADALSITAVGALNALAVRSLVVGQTIKRTSLASHPVECFLDKVSTRWGSDVPGMEALDAMPGSATGGLNYNTYLSGTTFGEIQISPLMR